ncbi:MAG: hypothetical protein ABSG21_15870 [Spirochaetia bacterium]|jgi:hypothetical protein
MVRTSDIMRRLQQLRSDLDNRLVITWLLDKRENPREIADAVALMAQVADILNGEIDLFIGSMGVSQEGDPSRPEHDNELVDLQTEHEADHPLDGTLSQEQPPTSG